MSDFKHAARPLLNRNRRKKLVAGNKGKGEKQQYTPLGFISGCPFCEWQTVGNTRRPIEVRVGPETKQASCRAGHTWTLQ